MRPKRCQIVFDTFASIGSVQDFLLFFSILITKLVHKYIAQVHYGSGLFIFFLPGFSDQLLDIFVLHQTILIGKRLLPVCVLLLLE